MSRKELHRPGLLKAVGEGRITNGQAATALRLSVRQVQRLKGRFQAGGPSPCDMAVAGGRRLGGWQMPCASRVRYIIRAGDLRFTTGTWRAANDAIAEAVKQGATVVNFLTSTITPGTAFQFGDATLTFMAGWAEWTDPGPTASERLNALSVLVRIAYRGVSVLLTGDTVGRRKGDPASACKDAEAVMVQRH